MKPIWVIGSGGHAKVVIDIARSSERYVVVGCLDDDPNREGELVNSVPVLGPCSPEFVRKRAIEQAVLAVGSNSARRDLAIRLDGLVTWTTLVHARAYVAKSAAVGDGTVVSAGAIIQPDVRIGNHVIVNTACSVDHDCQIGHFAHIGPGAHLAGSVSVGTGTLLGIGSSVIPGRSIGEWVTVGAGAVVVDNIQDEATVVGVPAYRVSKRKAI